MQHIARSKITDFISYIEIYSAFFSFFNNKWGNFAVIQRVVTVIIVTRNGPTGYIIT